MLPSAHPVLLYDGDCGLCHHVVRLLLRIDRAGRLHYAPLQGAAGQSYLRRHGIDAGALSTVIWVPDWEHPERRDFLVRSDAVAAALAACGGAAAVAGALLRAVPRPLRDAGYRLIGRVRHRLFGPPPTCPLPRPEWRRRILD